jgi:hypothetical protein
MAQIGLPAAADKFFKDTDKIQKGIRELLEAERRRAEEIQQAVELLQGQLKTAEASRLQLIDLTTNAQKLLINSQNQLGGLVGAVESLLSGSGNGAPEQAEPAKPAPEPAAAGGPGQSRGPLGRN